MPEGDTVWLAAKRLREALAGRTIASSDFRLPALATASVTGRVVNAVEPVGKHLLMRFDDGRTLHTHFRMDGSWHLYAPDDRWRVPSHAVRIVLRTQDRVAVGVRLHDVRLIATSEEHTVVGHLGPDILAADWNTEAVAERLRSMPDLEIGLALLEQRLVAGIGNLYRNEALFLRGVDPWTPVRHVDDLVGLLDTAHRLMDRNKGHWSQATTGEDARGREHYVFERARRPCRRCGTPIAIGRQGKAPRERLTYWCPSCQQRGADDE